MIPQLAWDRAEPDFKDAQDCHTCGNNGRVCVKCQGNYDDCPCPISGLRVEPCHDVDCDWRDE